MINMDEQHRLEMSYAIQHMDLGLESGAVRNES
jgi:hypothetical protein